MSSRSRTFIGYGILLVLTGLSIYSLLHLGADRFGGDVWSGSTVKSPDVKPHSNVLFLTLCSLSMVIVVSRLMGDLFKWIGQPRVMGEVVGGILLGPSLLSNVAPEFMAAVLPSQSLPFLSIIAQIGILLYMFVIGLELDLGVLKRSGHTALAISHASIVLPCLLGIGFAFFIYGKHAPLGVSFTSFSLFMGVSMSITAFPVLARILSDQGLQRTPLGILALTCAAVDDVTAWCLLALVVGILQSSVNGALVTIGLTFLYVLVMIYAVKPIFARLVPWLERSSETISESSMALILLCLLISALATEFIGVHALFGAFLLGAIIPPHSRIAEDLTTRLQDLVRVLFLPAFFAFTGMRTEIGLLSGTEDWAICAVAICVATLGKFGGAFLAAKVSGVATRESAAIGFLMNTRGLVQLIVLNVGLDLGVLTPRLFTILVIMALVTTLATGPALKWIKADPNRVTAA